VTALRRVPRAHLAAGAVLLLLLLYPVVNPWNPYSQGVMLLGFSLAVQASGWNIISGYAGYTSLGHSMFLGLGSYTVAIVVGAVVLRTRGHAFVIITIAVLLAAQILATNLDGLTNGSDGITLELPFWDADYQNIPFYYLFLVLLVLAVLFSAWIRRTKFGTGLVAIREDEGKAASIGVDTTRFKIVAYAASTFFIGVAGGVYAYYLTFLNPVGAFAILGSVMIVLASLLGGRGTLYGPVVGAFIVTGLNESATVYGGGSSSRVLLMGLALVAVVLFMPSGLLPTLERAWRSRRPETVEFTDQRGALSRSTATEAPAPAEVVDLADDPDAAEAAAIADPTAAGVARTRERALEELQSAAADDLEAGAPLLELRGVSKRFGGLVAVDDASLTVRKGTITALIGPNGSGKTTLFNLVTGNMAADSGEIAFEGRRIDRLPPWKRGHLGLGRTFQVTRLFREMTVVENVVAPLPDGRWRTMFADAVSGDEADRARELLDVVGLGRFAGQRAGSLSYGQQKLVELAQVLMLEPKLILLDEPAGGVNPSLLGRLTEVIRELNARGITFLVVEHNIPMVLDLCDPVVVFSRGRPIAEGTPQEIRHDPVVLDAYLGDDRRPASSGDGDGDPAAAETAPGHHLSTTERG
jgi:branched-chain amino acid transport system permease protein